MNKLAFLFVLIFLVVQGSPASAETPLNAAEILKKLTDEKITKAQLKDYHDSVKGKEIEGIGTVVDVLPGRADRHRVTILSPVSSPDKGYNIVLYVEMPEAPPLQKGQKVKIKGKVGRISGFRGLSIDVIGTYEQGSK